MSLALDKCFKVDFRGNQHEFLLCETAVESSNVIKDLEIHVSKHLTWTTHIDSRMSKANETFYCIRKNLEFKECVKIVNSNKRFRTFCASSGFKNSKLSVQNDQRS